MGEETDKKSAAALVLRGNEGNASPIAYVRDSVLHRDAQLCSAAVIRSRNTERKSPPDYVSSHLVITPGALDKGCHHAAGRISRLSFCNELIIAWFAFAWCQTLKLDLAFKMKNVLGKKIKGKLSIQLKHTLME